MNSPLDNSSYQSFPSIEIVDDSKFDIDIVEASKFDVDKVDASNIEFSSSAPSHGDISFINCPIEFVSIVVENVSSRRNPKALWK